MWQVQKADPSYGVGVNPISRLIQIMQAQKKKEPVYSLVAEKGLPRRREFVMQVSNGGLRTSRGRSDALTERGGMSLAHSCQGGGERGRGVGGLPGKVTVAQ